MNRRNRIAFRSATRSTFLALLFPFSGEALAQDQKPQGESSSTQHNSIKVHGHWTIEVRDPDGALVTHREFENELAPFTSALGLANVLGRVQTIGLWNVDVGNGNGGGPCIVNNNVLSPCIIAEIGYPIACNIIPNLRWKR